mmetsp:Transcript_16408/g.19695  ORF Transcript_16408/g.19695 Transcript_16408/m.19695 type:complete len:101 (-) Transcript_16408:198-500(-)|eukprot:jgi/Bigna1/138306/aug1.44_g13014
MTLAEDVVNSIFERGVNQGTIRVLNYVIAALIASIFLAIATGSGNIHVYILLFLSLGLLFSVNYFVGILYGPNPDDTDKKEENASPVKKKRSRSRSKKAE